MDVLGADLITCTYKDVKQRQKTVYENLQDPFAAKRLFSRIKYAGKKEKLDSEYLKQEGYDYVFRIQRSIQYKLISGSVAPASDPNNPNYRLDWEISTTGYNDTRIATSFYALENNTDYGNPILQHRVPIALAASIATGIGLLEVSGKITSGFTMFGSSVASYLIIGSVVALISAGLIVGVSVWASANALYDMEYLISMGNHQYEEKQYSQSYETFVKAKTIFDTNNWHSDHLKRGQYLHMLSIIGMGSSLQAQSNFGQIKSFSEESEVEYQNAIDLYEGKFNTENAWIGKAINAIYKHPEIALNYCSKFDSINSHMCQGEAYSYMYSIEKAPLEKAEEQFDIALDMTESSEQKGKIQTDIDNIRGYYNLPES